MSSATELLALRKEVLLARSKLQRLRIAHELGSVREQVRIPSGLALVHSPQARALAFGALMLFLGRSRLLRFVRIAAVATAGVKLARELASRRPAPAAPATGPQPPRALR